MTLEEEVLQLRLQLSVIDAGLPARFLPGEPPVKRIESYIRSAELVRLSLRVLGVRVTCDSLMLTRAANQWIRPS